MLNTQQLKSTFNNEQVLLLLLTRLYFSKADKTEIDTFIAAHPIDWQLFLKIISAHGLQSFIYYVLVHHGVTANENLMQGLKKRYANTRLKNFRQLQAATSLINAFKERGITIIPYKGAIFSQAYYADLAQRESIDIDFLIDRRDIKLVEDYMMAENYSPLTAVPRPFLNYYSKFFKDIVYQNRAIVGAAIEMHWRMVDRYAGSYPTYEFFKPHLANYHSGGLKIDKLKPTYDFLAMASNHFVKDMGVKFKYLVDMGCLISKEGEWLDVTVINNCAKKYGFEKKLSIGLQQINQLLGIEFANVNPQALPDALLTTPLQYPIALTRFYIDEPLFIKRALLLQDSFINKVKFILRCALYIFLPTYADINELKLPVYCLPLMIVIRPFRLLYKVLKSGKGVPAKL
jgi:hypothetical protein